MNDDRSDDPKSNREFAYGRSWQEYLVRQTGPGGESEEEPQEQEPQEQEPREQETREQEPAPEAPTAGRERTEEQPRSSRVVVPPEEDRAREGVGRSRRGRRLAGVLAVLALAVVALVVPRLLSSNGEAGGGGADAPAAGADAPTESGEAARPAGPGAGVADSAADTASTGRAGGGAPEPERPAPAGDVESDRQPSTERQIALMSARADSVAEAVARFRERRSDFDLNRIGCDGLARGLREVRAAYARLTAVYEPVQDRVGVSASARYQRLSDDVSGVERSFAATGCTASS